MSSGQPCQVEFIGMIGTRLVSEIHPASEPPVDPAIVRRFVDAHEQGGFDKVLVGHSASTPDGLQVAAYGAAQSGSRRRRGSRSRRSGRRPTQWPPPRTRCGPGRPRRRWGGRRRTP
ncbi:MAG TPA: hypothetical protein VGH76_17435 [Actinomycetospora sp.]|jgi:hypothetical protein|uniref:hypothetical protein n=1 Tax=Actinomycetospora sp. TaxID=1872135 RepID=UPI002F40294D